MHALGLTLLLALCATPGFGQTLDPIRYTVSFPAPHTHYLEVEASYPTERRSYIDLMMAVWTPGSYLIREYERHVEGLTATDSRRAPLEVEKTRKNRWRVTTNGAPVVSVRYRVYAHEMTVRTNWVDDEFAMINGAPTFITLLESPSRRAHDVRLVLPRTWSKSFSAMTPGPGENTYVAPDYDTLVDSPIVAGSAAVYEFSVRGKPHYLVNVRERGAWNGPQAAADLARVAETVAGFWGDVPFDRYLFMNVIGSTVNGLEHRNSTLMNIPLDAAKSREGYLQWLSLASHEYFHAWNVKRLRPIELGPFDYENEVYTRSLWFVEGITDYYADLFLVRAGLATRDEYLDALSAQVRSLQTTPGRLEQPVEAASYDAWIKYYRADENTPNTAISYYVKGAVIGFLLDADIRRLTNGAKSLDDVMRLMRSRYSAENGFSRDDIRSVVAEVVGTAHAREVRAWMARALETTAELDYEDALAWFGLRMTARAVPPRPYLGIATRTENGNTVITGIRRGSPAAAAGLSLLDEISAINGTPLVAGQLTQTLERLSPGAKAAFRITRRGEMRDIDIVLTVDPGHGWQLSSSPGSTPDQLQHLDAWLRAQ
jgi:predicted metalloprotease with PDZ domain